MESNANNLTSEGLWIPGWYELDQPLKVGVYERFWFYQQVPFDILARPELKQYFRADHDCQVEFVFFNSLLTSESNCEMRYARIQSIAHSSIGVIREVKTDGLDYLFFPETGEPISVNAEEAPGYTDGDFVEVSDWTLQVSLSEISEPVDPT